MTKQCDCKDHSGKEKTKYATYEDAEAIKLDKRRKGVDLWIYECPLRDGFHLTSHSQGDGAEQEHKLNVRKHTKSKQRNPKGKIRNRVDEDTLNKLISLRDDLRKPPE